MESGFPISDVSLKVHEKMGAENLDNAKRYTREQLAKQNLNNSSQKRA
jgi:hypothetical protein